MGPTEGRTTTRRQAHPELLERVPMLIAADPIRKKEVGPAFAIWLFLGWCGAHRFYLNRFRTGLVMLAWTQLSFALMIVIIGFVMLPVVMVWWVVDAFLISTWVAEHNAWVEGVLGTEPEDDIVKEWSDPLQVGDRES